MRETDAGVAWTPVTRAQFRNDVEQLAAGLSRLGIKPGDRVLTMVGTRYEWEVADKGVMLCGAVAVAVDLKSTDADIAYIVTQAGVSAAIVEDETQVAKLPPDFADTATATIVIRAEHGALPGIHRFAELLAARDGTAEIRDTARPDTLAAILFTSGTTGKPKGIPFGHRQLACGCPIMAEFLAGHIAPGDTTLTWLPLNNATGRFISMMCLYFGVRQYFLSDPKRLPEAIGKVNPHLFFGVPRLFEKIHDGLRRKFATQSPPVRILLDGIIRLRQRVHGSLVAPLVDRLMIHAIREKVFGPNIRLLFCGSAPIHPKILAFFQGLGARIIECYGFSENAILVAMNRPDDIRIGTVGPPLPGNTIRISPEGELRVKSEALFEGYLNDSDRAQLFDEEGFYRTGDLVQIDDGALRIVGRSREIIKTSNGVRISPVEVENAYRAIPFLEHVVAIGDNRPYLVGLVTIDEQAFRTYVEDKGIDVSNTEPQGSSPRVRDILLREWERVGQPLAPNKRLRRVIALAERFSVESGELTPTLKLRRGVISKKYGDQIERIYGESS